MFYLRFRFEWSRSRPIGQLVAVIPQQELPSDNAAENDMSGWNALPGRMERCLLKVPSDGLVQTEQRSAQA